MAEYYFLTSLLPPLAIEHVPSLSFIELKDLLKINLTDKDKEIVKRFLSIIDMDNLRALWANEPHDIRGNYTREEIEHSLTYQAWPGDIEFPTYLKEFIEKYPNDKDKVEHFDVLMSRFLKEGEEDEDPFLSQYFAFERGMRLTLVGFRAKKLGRNLSKELQYEDPYEPLVAEILAQKDAAAYEPPFEFKELKPIFLSFAEFPLELHKALLAYSFDKITDFYGNSLFSIDRILGFMARLLIVEKWLELDMQEGITMIGKIEESVQ